MRLKTIGAVVAVALLSVMPVLAVNPPEGTNHSVSVAAGTCPDGDVHRGDTVTIGDGTWGCVCSNYGTIPANPSNINTSVAGWKNGTLTWAASCGGSTGSASNNYNFAVVAVQSLSASPAVTPIGNSNIGYTMTTDPAGYTDMVTLTPADYSTAGSNIATAVCGTSSTNCAVTVVKVTSLSASLDLVPIGATNIVYTMTTEPAGYTNMVTLTPADCSTAGSNIATAVCGTSSTNCAVTVLKVDIEQAETNTCVHHDSVSLNLTSDSCLGSGTANWSSTPPGISGNGANITFNPGELEPGEYTVTAVSTLLPSVSDTCHLRVVKVEFDVDNDTVACGQGGTYDVKAKLAADTYDFDNLTWTITTLGGANAAIDENGVVTFGNAAGQYSIEAKSADLPDCNDTFQLTCYQLAVEGIDWDVDYNTLTADGSYVSVPQDAGISGPLTMVPASYDDVQADGGNYEFDGYSDDDELLTTFNIYINSVPTEVSLPSQVDTPQPNEQTIDPIDLRTGDNRVSETDLIVPCPGLNLEWRRMYHSATSSTPRVANPTRMVYPDIKTDSGTLGSGWTHSYNWRIVARNIQYQTIDLAYMQENAGFACKYITLTERRSKRSLTYQGWSDEIMFDDHMNYMAIQNVTFDSFGHVKSRVPLVLSEPIRTPLKEGNAATASMGGWAIRRIWVSKPCLILKAWDGGEYYLDQTNTDHYRLRGLNGAVEKSANGYTLSLAGGVSMTFHLEGQLTGIRDAWSNAVTLAYTDGKLTRVEHNNGQAFELTYASGLLSRVEAAGGLAVNYYYVGACLDHAVVVAADVSKRTDYAYNPFLVSRVNSAGHCSRYEYALDTNGQPSSRCIGMRLTQGVADEPPYYYEHHVGYGPAWPQITNSLTYVRNGTAQFFEYAWNSNTTLRDIVGPAGTGRQQSFDYDTNGNIAVKVVLDQAVGESVIERTGYSPSGNVLSNGVGYGQEPEKWWLTQWDTNDVYPTMSTDPEGHYVQYAFSKGKLDRIWSEVSGDVGFDLRFGYTTNGQVAALTNALGHWTRYAYDQWGFPARVTPQVGPEKLCAFDQLGHLTNLVMPGNRVTGFSPDAVGRVRSMTWPDGQGEQFQYDALGNLTNRVDRAGRTTRLSWLPTRKLASVTRWLDQQPVSISCAYDTQFNVLRITDPLGRNVETYQLDLQDRPVAVTNLDGQTMQIQYGVGRFVKAVTRFDGSTLNYAYDGEGRLTGMTYPTLSNAYTYDSDGKLKTAGNEQGTVRMTYDALDRLTGVSNPVPNGVLDYAYDSAGNVTSTVSVAGETDYAYDQAERRAGQRSSCAGFDYTYNSSNGLLESVSNTITGARQLADYNILDRLTTLSWLDSTGTVQRGFAYQYSVVGMITNVAMESGEQAAYTYDSLDRLIGERKFDATGTVTYAAAYFYDLAGNRTQTVINGATNDYTLGTGNKLASWSSAGLVGYSAAGNVTSLQYSATNVLALQWNDRYQVTGIMTNGGLAETYGYDALGRRISISDGTITNYLVYDGIHVVGEVGTSVSLVRSYTYGPGIDNILSMTVHGETTNTYYYIKDHLGSVQAIVDSSGSIVESYQYDAWGNVLNVIDSSGTSIENRQSQIGNRFLWQGREYSWKTGLYNFRARWYDPVTGSWLSNDPIGIGGGLNQYVFCANNPVNFVDPFGLCAEEQQGFWGLSGNALNNTVSAINQSMGQGLYDLTQGQFSDNVYNQIGNQMWSTDTPAAPQATPYISTALGISAAAAATAAIAGGVEAATGIRVEIHGTHGWTTPHLQGIQGDPGIGAPSWGDTLWRWPAH